MTTRSAQPGTRPVWLAMLLVLSGCGGEPENQFEHLELLPSEEELTEFDLGQYAVPVPETRRIREGHHAARNTVRVEFTLRALIAPSDEDRLATSWAQHESRFRDRVIQICRTARLEELAEPELPTLRYRLLEAAEPLLGGDRIRRLVVTGYSTQKM